ncbi:hypothetical protein [Amycolatopsis sp. Poz14]|uniref:hypothetical protein n=1 Tax=Amycolatopsis sp. Poz14 TaxID=1447705 RepID=UPI001EE803F8|nr:hypothetical protein [Amycolatopsis sp. Poz14]MCG3749907.1 hypothetical protein [Amycolatopsis sp. Poz14]
MYIYARRRSLTFSGKQVTIKAAIKDGLFGADKKHSFTVSRISGVSNTEPGAFSPGCLKFKVTGASTAVIENPASGGDKADLCTFYYSSSDRKKVRELVAAVKAAMPQ